MSKKEDTKVLPLYSYNLKIFMGLFLVIYVIGFLSIWAISSLSSKGEVICLGSFLVNFILFFGLFNISYNVKILFTYSWLKTLIAFLLSIAFTSFNLLLSLVIYLNKTGQNLG